MDDWPLSAPDLSPPGTATVHCWRVPIDAVDDAAARRLRALLDPSERARHDRLRMDDDRRRFVASHAAVRILVGAALRRDPHAVAFATGPYGKPFVPAEPLTFSMTHSGRFALVALAAATPVGVDVEEVRSFPDRDAIAERFFHPLEARELGTDANDVDEAAFFRAWTRKEAVAKALGLGLSLAFDGFRVTSRDAEPPRVLELPPPHPPPASWTLLDLIPGAGHVGAVALPQRPVRLTRRTLDLTLAKAFAAVR